MPSETTLRVGTRGSPLALGQTGQFTAHLAETHPMLGAPGAVETVVITTTGDRVQNRLLLELGGKGLFTKELDEALLDGRIDLAIHSMKDVPAELPVGIVLTAVLPREDVHDAFISRKAASLSELPPGSTVGTASLRRKTQIINRYPELRVVPLRGNVDTRLGKLDAGDYVNFVVGVTGFILAHIGPIFHDMYPWNDVAQQSAVCVLHPERDRSRISKVVQERKLGGQFIDVHV